MTLGSGGDPNADHTARRLILEVQALVERLQHQLELLDQRVRDDTKVVRHTLTLIGDEIFQDQRRRKEQRAKDEEARIEAKRQDIELRVARQIELDHIMKTQKQELDHTLKVQSRILIGIVIILSVAILLFIGARFL